MTQALGIFVVASMTTGFLVCLVMAVCRVSLTVFGFRSRQMMSLLQRYRPRSN
jgi:hypothetical protein